MLYHTHNFLKNALKKLRENQIFSKEMLFFHNDSFIFAKRSPSGRGPYPTA